MFAFAVAAGRRVLTDARSGVVVGGAPAAFCGCGGAHQQMIAAQIDRQPSSNRF
jgi:hypothetical protein